MQPHDHIVEPPSLPDLFLRTCLVDIGTQEIDAGHATVGARRAGAADVDTSPHSFRS